MKCSHRLWPVTLALVVASSVSVIAQQPALTVEHGTYAVHLLLHRIGTEQYTVTETGSGRQLNVTTTTNDRGTSRTIATTLDFAVDNSPKRLEQHNSASPDGILLTETNGLNVTVHEDTQTRTVRKPLLAYMGFNSMPAAQQMLMMRYWLRHHRPPQLPILRASTKALPVVIKEVGHEAFNLQGQTVRLTRYTVANLIYGREILWMNDSYRVAAVMTFAGGLPQEEILDEYLSGFDQLYQSGIRQEMLDLADLTHAVPPIAAGSFAIVGARLIDATGAPPVLNSTVIVREGRIAAAGPSASIKVPVGMRVVHAEGKSLLPGLWEMHSHYSGVEFGPALLSAGVTTARDCGGEFSFLTTVRQAIEREHQLGPRLLMAGLIDSGGPLAFGPVDVKTPAEAVHKVDFYADNHVEQIKVYTQIQPDVLRAISAEAHNRGMTVTGHVPAAINAFDGVADGMDQINHLQFVTRAMNADGQNGPVDLNSDRARKLIALLAEKHIVIDPTIGWGEMASHPRSIDPTTFEPGLNSAPFTLSSRFVAMGSTAPEAEKNFRERMATNLAVVGALVRAHVPIVAGSDTNLIGYGLDRELELYVQAGMTPMQAIQSATLEAARAMRLDAESGTVEAGKRADLVLIDGDPLNNISDIRHVASVVANGRMYSSRALARSVGFTR